MMVSANDLLSVIRDSRRGRPQVERLGRSIEVSIAGSDLMLAMRVAARIRRLAIMDDPLDADEAVAWWVKLETVEHGGILSLDEWCDLKPVVGRVAA